MTTRETLHLLQAYESRNVTHIEPDGSWPIVWAKANGVKVWDAEGREYLDLTAAFGVAAAGHANPRVVKAGQAQMAKLLHAMGDVHPHALKARLARELSRITFERWTAGRSKRTGGRVTGKTIFCNSGFEAVEAALKTAYLATGKREIIAFEGAYHGLGYGALNATHRSHFRSPFLAQLGEFGTFVPFPEDSPGRRHAAKRPGTEHRFKDLAGALERVFKRGMIGAVLVEPIQVRGGIRIPPPGFLPLLCRLCDRHGALLILDEIYTGFGRTGKWFACEHSKVTPDLICLGKGLTGGFPLSACVGRGDLMDRAWPPSAGEAIHTSTFLGHPVGCAMALAQIREIEARGLVERSERLGVELLGLLKNIRLDNKELRVVARGLGLLAGVELLSRNGTPATELSIGIMKAMLGEGFIVLPEGEHSNVIGFTPPLVISRRQLSSAVSAFQRLLQEQGAASA
jgi:4-aminobutyrate aminotransferase-like enzyme